MRAIALTLFPEMFPGPLGCSLAGKALQKGIWSLEALDIRSFAHDKHKTVDDSPYGGGVGMVMKPDVVDAAVKAAKALLTSPSPCRGEGRRGGNTGEISRVSPPPSMAMVKKRHPDVVFSTIEPPPERGREPCIIYTSPRGTPFTQSLANQLKVLDLIILCGRFEGVDQRVIEHHDMLEISLGDFVLSGGEIAALAILDACVRLLPGVIGKEEALAEESFSVTPSWPEFHRNSKAIQSLKLDHPRVCFTNPGDDDFARLLEYPHYTRPSLWKGKAVPDVLLSGNHEEIRSWRLEQAKTITAARRPDLNKE